MLRPFGCYAEAICRRVIEKRESFFTFLLSRFQARLKTNGKVLFGNKEIADWPKRKRSLTKSLKNLRIEIHRLIHFNPNKFSSKLLFNLTFKFYLYHIFLLKNQHEIFFQLLSVMHFLIYPNTDLDPYIKFLSIPIPPLLNANSKHIL